MSRFLALALFMLGCGAFCCHAQESTSDKQGSPAPTGTADPPANSAYSSPTQGERFKSYLRHTFGINSIVEAGIRGGIQQAQNRPSQWPQGAEGYGDRFGSSMGQIAARSTTEFIVADIFREDIRFMPRSSSGAQSKFKAALEDTFLARKGEDGHSAFSVAHLVGPAAGSAIAINAWYPSGRSGSDIARETAFSYGFQFVRNLLRELRAH